MTMASLKRGRKSEADRELVLAERELKRLDRGLASVTEELKAIKRLMIVFMLRSGLGQRDVAKALGVDQAVVSRMFKGIGRKVVIRNAGGISE
jgi:DNA-directed RNA polymerase specialized sigma subunit